ncbi:hypothetical protein SAMN04488057_12438 [Cyclobacterium lianum]|uniref:Uncharacterized protein n=1 Tax=Cyclobacterium lianum TaxID=388280 RepID=A0A1M7QTH8_9BACT|nr:hypothetical protein [Cyclobacterium lianum]SHN35041.1 hypothetical protein SAMN04488057_12438 [Cyclobacterium lianum]
MKFLVKLILVSFIGMVAMFGAFGSENEWPGLIVAVTVWVWFIYSLSKPKVRNPDQTIRELERRNEELLRELERRGH